MVDDNDERSQLYQSQRSTWVPDSIGALLAEEWTINPHSALPTFLEMMRIEETKQSGWRALRWAMKWLEDRLSRMAVEGRATESNDNSNFLLSFLSSYRIRFANFVARHILRPYGLELRCLLSYWLERRSLLSNSSATISETMHGGKRVKLEPEFYSQDYLGSKFPQRGHSRRLLPMSKTDAIRLALFMAVGHYLEERGNQIMRRHESSGLGSSHSSARFSFTLLLARFKKIIKTIYPYLYMTVQGMRILNQWKYLLGQSVFFDLYSQWLNLIVRRVTVEDETSSLMSLTKEATNTSNTGESRNDDSKSMLARGVLSSHKQRVILQRIAIGLLSYFTILSWLAQLREVRQELRRQALQQDSSSGVTTSTTSSMIPPPPREPIVVTKTTNSSKRSRYYPSSLPSTFCPICKQPRVNPTASTGGYVFCLKCLLAAIRENPVCPITGKECPEKSIVRLYEPRHV